jgi:hypothetical protein
MMVKFKVSNERPAEAQCKSTLSSIADALYAIGGKWKVENHCGFKRRE